MKSSKSDTKLKKKPQKKSTHLFLNNKKLATIPAGSYTHFSVFYLQDNSIKEINNLQSAVNLTHLYLHNNQIEKLDNLSPLVNLKKVYLGNNQISVVENLEKLTKLEELHIERQKLKCGDSLCFDPRTLMALSDTLEVVNISHNNILTLSNMRILKQLRIINAGWNRLKDLDELCQVVSNWSLLESANFTGNPIVKQRLYTEKIIQHTYYMDTLDNKKVTKNTRNFIKLLENKKLTHESKISLNITDIIPDVSKRYPLALQNQASKALMSGDCLQTPTVSKVSLAWTSRKCQRKRVIVVHKDVLFPIRQQSLPRDLSLFTHWLQ